MSVATANRVAGSFRDPSGFVFVQDGVLYRSVAKCYRKNYDLLLSSGLYQSLVFDRLMVAHEEQPNVPTAAYKLLKPELVKFVSYPYEWCFSQLKDAALATLLIEDRALEHGMTLKDASAFNIQFLKGRPTLIDTLSFEKYEEGQPWVAYKQFCQHFLAPLALISAVDMRLGKMLLQTKIDGVDLDLAAKLLPWQCRLDGGLLVHLFTHAAMINKYSHETGEEAPALARQFKMPKDVLVELIRDLSHTIKRLELKHGIISEWSDYYENTNYIDSALAAKEQLVQEFLQVVKPATVWDLGANVGNYSRLAARHGAHVVSMDYDPLCVEHNYLRTVRDGEPAILPIVVDLVAPSPSIGWNNSERMSLKDRGPADLILALALAHHICLENNVPFEDLFKFLAEIGRYIVIEFVPRDDSQVKRMLAWRSDVVDYDEEHFESASSRYFQLVRKEPIVTSRRTLYLLKRL